MSNESARYCRSCDRDVTPTRRSPLWRAALVSVALVFVLMVLASSLIGPFIMFAVPFMALFGFALGPLHALSSEPPTCPHCHREVPFRTRAQVSSARVPLRSTAFARTA